MQSDMRELDGRVNRMGVEIKEVGALSAALAGLHPQPENANSRADFAMAMGSYEGKQALAVGGFYRPDKRTMLSIGGSTTSSKHMMNMGISIALDRLPEAERRAKEAAKAAGVEQETLNRVLERLAALEQDNRRLQADNEKRDVAYEKLAADYTQLKEKYIELIRIIGVKTFCRIDARIMVSNYNDIDAILSSPISDRNLYFVEINVMPTVNTNNSFGFSYAGFRDSPSQAKLLRLLDSNYPQMDVHTFVLATTLLAYYI